MANCHRRLARIKHTLLSYLLGLRARLGSGCLLALGAAVLVISSGNLMSAQSTDKFRKARLNMVDQVIAPEGITNTAVLDSMRQVPRHMFVPADLREQGYADHAIPIGHKQTISPPYIVAYMTQALDPQPTDSVLEIGTGSGYQAAILSNIVKEVYTIEIVEPLGTKAAKRLKELGYKNVHALVGDGFKGWPEHAPFDRIIVTCSPESVPQPLVEQLREGGRMIIPLGERYQQVFYLFEKRNGELVKTQLVPTLFVPMTGRSEEERKIKPDPANPAVRNGGFELDTKKDGHPDNWHYQRQLTVEHDDPPEGNSFVTVRNSEKGRTAQALQGMALDGRVVGQVHMSLSVKGKQVGPGNARWERAALFIHFFDSDRKRIGEAHLGPWEGTFNWKRESADLDVPIACREAIIQVGLNGGTGELSIDDVQLKGKLR